MTFEQKKIFEAKQVFRRALMERPIAEKLRILDALRERELAIRGRTGPPAAATVREAPVPYRPDRSE
jgi:hypothetical protein